jgi:precorrin-6Y C5,15-methyltransferase (decarboxylating) CbiT subunit
MAHLLGIKDEEFIRGKVPMTKEEIRIVTLAKAKIKKSDTVLDIGAGTGSLSIEAALLAEQGHVYAIERNSEGVSLIKENMAKFNVGNLTVIETCAPQGMENLPPCDVIFIGGSGARLKEIFIAAQRLLKTGGRLIINSVTIETVYRAIEYLKNSPSFSYEAVQIQASRYKLTGSYHLAQAMNPVSIITAVKKA